MRPAPPELVARIASGAATLCRCWKLTRRDGVVLGFTDHDRKLAFDEVSYEPESGFTASEIETSLGLSVGGAEAQGALSSARIAPEDLAGGLYDRARIELWLVDWRDPAARFLLSSATIGETRRNRGHFTAEMRGLAHALNIPGGRVYQRACDAELGDARCGVNLERPAFRAAVLVAEVARKTRFRVTGADAFEAAFFLRGVIRWSAGSNPGLLSQIRADDAAASGGGRWIQIWHPPPRPIAPGDALFLFAGCDKRLETCRMRFANALNFRGFPDIPGDDAANSYPNSGDNMDGGSLND